ncbi:MAG: hypothetical protein JNJ80_08875 [Gemmatimonadetes bacterium]|nr:hypothetical protein [Gemmatimonadota bacterium]MCC7134690.1 hypothetical protein [Gemmatimonadales bacterium]
MTAPCQVCGVPADAHVFDRSWVGAPPERPGEEVVLVRFELHRNYCGQLLYFAQYTDRYAADPRQVRTDGYQWVIRNPAGLPLLAVDHIVNPWGMSGFPLDVRLEEGASLEFVLRNVGAPVGGPGRLGLVGGRLVGRSWYNAMYGGAPNRL